MFCDNPKCKLHAFDDQDHIETFETNVNYFMTGGPASGTVMHSNRTMVDPASQTEYKLCDVCVGVIDNVIEMRKAYDKLTSFQKAVARATNERVVNENDQH